MNKYQQPSADPLASLIKDSGLEIPFSDFDDKVMRRIAGESIATAGISRDRKLSLVFFMLVVLLGIALNSMVIHIPFNIPDLPQNTSVLLFQLAFVCITLIQLDKNLPVIRDWKKGTLRG